MISIRPEGALVDLAPAVPNGSPAFPEGEVIVPSFTFPATVHPVVWNGLSPVFCDVSPDTLTLSPEAAAEATGRYTSAIVATHIYGTPCRVEELAEVAASRGLRLFFDAAHA